MNETFESVATPIRTEGSAQSLEHWAEIHLAKRRAITRKAMLEGIRHHAFRGAINATCTEAEFRAALESFNSIPIGFKILGSGRVKE